MLGLIANGIRAVYDQNLPLFQQLYSGPFDPHRHHETVDAVRCRDAGRARAAMEAFGAAALGGAR